MKITQKNLLNTFPKLSPKQALQITKLANGTLDPETFEVARQRVSECYNRPENTDLILHIVESMIGGCGVSGVEYETDAIYSEDFISYVNRGDTYAVTVLWSPRTQNFIISDWGSEYEVSPAYQSATEQDGEAV